MGGDGGRRAFLKAAASAGLLFVGGGRALAQRGPASLRVRLGVLGFGAQGARLAAAARGILGSEVVAVADLYDGRLGRAREVLGEKVAAVRDYRQVLERTDVDAVVIATPDHWHAPLALESLAAGKDVYCESPLTHRPEEGAVLARAAAEAKRVFQSGSGSPSSPLWTTARELVRSGRLGRVTLASGVWDTSGALHAWQFPFPPDASPETVDFKAFLGPAPAREFDLHRFFRWRRYWDYGTGLAGERFAPQLSALHGLLGLGPPVRVVASGAVRLWKDGREVPDTLVAAFEYKEGVTVSLGATQCGGARVELRLVGSEATLVLRPGELELLPEPLTEAYPLVGETWAREYRTWFYMIHGLLPDGQLRGAPVPEKASERWVLPAGASAASAHLADFVACVRSRGETREPLALGLTAAAGVHMANQAFREGRVAAREPAA